LELRFGLSVKIFDVAIVSPGCPSYVALGSDTTSLRAAAKKESDKVSKYATALSTLGYPPDVLIPFVVEASGQLGARAAAWIDGIRDSTVGASPTFFLDRLQVLVARYNVLLDQAHEVEVVRRPPPVLEPIDSPPFTPERIVELHCH